MTDEVEFDDAELGFAPAVSADGADEGRSSRTAPAGSRRRRLHAPRTMGRKLGAGVVLLGALGLMGGAYATFAGGSAGAADATTSAQISQGKQLYQTSCITCHGANLEGIKGQGVSLIGVGEAAAYFQLSTGRMPLAQQGAYAPQKEAKFTEAQIDAIAAYIESVGGGPTLPAEVRGDSSTIAEGGELFRLNCASCHGTTFKGAPLSAGKVAPSLNNASDKEIYAAMLSGPESMPVFSDNQLTPQEKQAIVAYIQTIKASDDPGGNGIDRIGPVSEAIVIWVGGIGALMIAILWIGARAR